MNNRFKEIRKELNMTQKEMGSILGILNSTISDIEKGKANLTDRNITLICEKLAVSEEWLRFGTGEMFRPDLPTDDTTALLAKLDLEGNPKTKMFLEIYDQLDEKSQTVLLDLARSLQKNIEQKK